MHGTKMHVFQRILGKSTWKFRINVCGLIAFDLLQLVRCSLQLNATRVHATKGSRVGTYIVLHTYGLGLRVYNASYTDPTYIPTCMEHLKQGRSQPQLDQKTLHS